MAPFLPDMVARLRAFGELDLDDATAARLCGMSAATIDRRLAGKRERLELKGCSRLKPGSLLKSQIPIFARARQRLARCARPLRPLLSLSLPLRSELGRTPPPFSQVAANRARAVECGGCSGVKVMSAAPPRHSVASPYSRATPEPRWLVSLLSGTTELSSPNCSNQAAPTSFFPPSFTQIPTTRSSPSLPGTRPTFRPIARPRQPAVRTQDRGRGSVHAPCVR
jgi:hypothetical protein